MVEQSFLLIVTPEKRTPETMEALNSVSSYIALCTSMLGLSEHKPCFCKSLRWILDSPYVCPKLIRDNDQDVWQGARFCFAMGSGTS